ncbi:pirin family protein [Mariniflexile ostreae]|uniref:Pirin family protein n=1 Tax=Mariniflexile ostreae TaxID=1520892 RepID=A0ABV5F9C4_9FLAO
MKIIIHKASNRGVADHGWLLAHHSFSFASFFDKDKVQFGALRVLNDDVIAPKMGFGTHAHKNMEIITIPLKGVLKHRDSMHEDWQSVLPGEVQVMSAGSGIEHSEINGSLEEHLSLFQIWIVPNKRDVTPRYDQKLFRDENHKNKTQVLVSSINENQENSLKIHQDALISRMDLDKDKSFKYHLKSETHGVYVMVIHGHVTISSTDLTTRDAIGISETKLFSIMSNEDSSLLFIEVPMAF